MKPLSHMFFFVYSISNMRNFIHLQSTYKLQKKPIRIYHFLQCTSYYKIEILQFQNNLKTLRFRSDPTNLSLCALFSISFFSVDFLMFLEQSTRHESFVALRALVRSFSRVGPLMQHQWRSLRETRAALLTHVRLFASMRSLVDDHILLAGKLLVTPVALEDLLARMVALVHQQSSHWRQFRAA